MLYINYALIINGSCSYKKNSRLICWQYFKTMNLNPNEMKYTGFD